MAWCGISRTETRAALVILLLGFVSCNTRDTWEKQEPLSRESTDLGASTAVVGDSIPRFEDYPVSRIYHGKPAPVNLFSHHNARRLRDRLVEGAKKGPNFAGHYTMITWGGGAGGQQVALVEARTGLVFLPAFVSHFGCRFRLDSRLLIANPQEEVRKAIQAGAAQDIYRTVYYVWQYNGFRPVHTIQH